MEWKEREFGCLGWSSHFVGSQDLWPPEILAYPLDDIPSRSDDMASEDLECPGIVLYDC